MLQALLTQYHGIYKSLNIIVGYTYGKLQLQIDSLHAFTT